LINMRSASVIAGFKMVCYAYISQVKFNAIASVVGK